MLHLRRFTILLPLLAVLLAVLLAACGGSSNAPTTTSASPAPKTGPRIVSTVPAATLQLLQLGAADDLVGVSSYDRLVLPEDKQNLPVVGDYLEFRYETILSLKPTAMIVQIADDRMAPRLKELAIARKFELVNLRLDTIADLFASVRKLGQITGRQQTAENKIALVRSQLDLIRRKTDPLPKPKVVYIIARNPTYIVGGHRFMDEMITIAGGKNLGATLASDFPTISREDLLRLAPEVLLVAAPGEPAPHDASDPRLAPWRDLPVPAGQTGRVYLITGLNSQMASLDIAEETLALAKLLHPDLKAWDLPPDTAPASAPASARRTDKAPGAAGMEGGG